MLSAGKAILYLPSILLLALAINQLILANFFDLSPWLGGGYGMFSTADVGSNRHIHVYSKSEGVIKEIVYPLNLNELALKTKSFPTNQNLSNFAYKISEFEQDTNTSSIEVQVWKSDFKKKSLQPSSYLLKSLEVHLN